MCEIDIANLYQQEYDHIFACVLKRVHDWHAAEDIVQTVFQEVMQHAVQRDALLTHPAPVLYLLAAARNAVYDYCRRESTRKTYAFSSIFTELAEDQLDVLAADEEWVEGIINTCDMAMTAATVRALLQKYCTEQQLQIIELRYGQNLPPHEVALRLGLNATRYNRQHNALLHMLAERINPQPKRAKALCGVEGCDSPVQGRGLCNRHYVQWRKGKNLPALPPKAAKGCATEGCEEKHYSSGLCRRCYRQRERRERMAQRRDASRVLGGCVS